MKTYSLKFTAVGVEYLRRVLGRQPYDEAGQMIQSIEAQCAVADNPPPPVLTDQVPASPEAKPNGTGATPPQ